jgi:hypothetical protein
MATKQYFSHAELKAMAQERERLNPPPAILDCGHTPTTPHSPITSGTAHTADGKEICTDCADAMQREELQTATKTYGYLDKKRKQITTWTGGKLATLTAARTIGHNLAGTMIAWNAVDDNGQRWYGRNSGDGMATVMHRAKR